MINEYISYLANVKMYSTNTLRRYAAVLHRFAMAHGGCRWSSISTNDVERYVGALSCSASSKRNTLSILRAFFGYLVHHFGLGSNPCRFIPLAKAKKGCPDVLKMSTIGRVVRSTASTAVQLAILLMSRMGLRVCECLSASVQDISEGRLKVHGKGNKERSLVIPSYVMSRIRSLGCRGLFFENWDDRGFRRAIWYAFHACGVSTHPHALRHSFASELVNAGMPLNQIQILMGHESIETTEKYLHTACAEIDNNYLSIIK